MKITEQQRKEALSFIESGTEIIVEVETLSNEYFWYFSEVEDMSEAMNITQEEAFELLKSDYVVVFHKNEDENWFTCLRHITSNDDSESEAFDSNEDALSMIIELYSNKKLILNY